MVRKLFLGLFPCYVSAFSAIVGQSVGKGGCLYERVWGCVIVHGLGVARLGHVDMRRFGRTRGLPLMIMLSGVHDLRGVNSIFHASSTFHVRYVCLYNVATVPPRPRVRGATLKTRFAMS